MPFLKNKFAGFLKGVFPFLGIFIVIFIFKFTNWALLKYYPVCVNFSVFCMFLISYFQKETVIQKFAQKLDGPLPPSALNYTRKLTYIWAFVTFLNFLISSASVFVSDDFWALYNGFLSYIFIGTVFGVEYIVRIKFKRKHGL